MKIIDPGVPNTLVQNDTYALPDHVVYITSSDVLEFSNSTTNSTTATTFQRNTLSTTGMPTSSLFCRCTGAAAIVSAKRY